jgi:tetratricopeptide (TPR) repeat protein
MYTIKQISIFLCFASLSSGSSQPQALDSQIAGAVTLIQTGQYEKAERTLRNVWKRIEPTRDQRRLAVLNDLGAAVYYLNRLPEAESLYRRSLQERESAPLADVASALSNLAVLYQRTGRPGDAEDMFRQALTIRERVFGPDSPQAGLSHENLAQIYRSTARLVAAEQNARRAIDSLRAAGPAYQANLNQAMQTLGTVLRLQQKFGESELLLVRSLQAQRARGAKAPLASAAAALGELRIDQHRYGDARVLIEEAIHLWRTEVGEHSPNVAAALNNLAQISKLSGRFGEAEELYRESMAMWERTTGPMTVEYGLTVGNFADLFRAEGKFRGAMKLYQRSLEILEPRLGPNHPTVISERAALDQVAVRKAARERQVIVNYRDLRNP